MATPSKVKLSLSDKPAFYTRGRTQEALDKASELLQKNHDEHHIFFNNDGFHNHIAHHLLTLSALGASSQQIQQGYNHNALYQRPPESLEPEVIEDMHDPEKFSKFLGKEHYYHDFLLFFQSEMEAKGWENVVNEYLFKGDERGDDMLCRLFAGFLHPIIHLGFGVEFNQPAIVAEALAQAAVHDRWMAPLFLGAEEAATRQSGKEEGKKSLVQLLDEIKANETITGAPKWSDGNKLREGLVKRTPGEMIRIVSQFTVSEDELEEKVAEMTNLCAYFTGAAQRPPHQIRIDFFYMHCINASIFFSAFIATPWLSTASKIRLLEWKGRNDLAMYASRASPDLLIDEVTSYKPRRESGWEGIFERVKDYEDDGHGSKLVRALAHGEAICKPYESRECFRIKGRDWLQLGHMAIDSVEEGQESGTVWVRSCGFAEAWEKIPERANL